MWGCFLIRKGKKKKKGLEAARSQNAVASVAKMRGTEFDKHKCSVRYLRCHTFVEIKSYENEGKEDILKSSITN